MLCSWSLVQNTLIIFIVDTVAFLLDGLFCEDSPLFFHDPTVAAQAKNPPSSIRILWTFGPGSAAIDVGGVLPS